MSQVTAEFVIKAIITDEAKGSHFVCYHKATDTVNVFGISTRSQAGREMLQEAIVGDVILVNLELRRL